MKVAVLVLGAGLGERLGGELPKAFVPLLGRSLLVRSLAVMAAVPEVDRVVPVVAPGDLERFAELDVAGIPKLTAPVPGGEERQDSMRAGLAALDDGISLVVVHDAARPLVTAGEVSRAIDAARECGAALLAHPVRDTIKRVREGAVVETPERSQCYGAQTPQVFRRELLVESLARAEAEGVVATDDAQLVERLGQRVQVVEGSPENIKITLPADLTLAEAILRSRGEGPSTGEGRGQGSGEGRDVGKDERVSARIGQGFDAHQLAAGRPLVLGGVEIPSSEGLLGHSDGDVLLHAVSDGILGALGEGDLGRHFPSSDPALEGIESGKILARVVAMMRQRGLSVGNLDATVIAQAPRLAPHQEKMRASLAGLLGVDEERVNLKVTSTDHLGALGRGEGIASLAVVLLEPAGEAG
jgi:2-C-methyl-D-erythritol 4-phosphate cytidylyltransferase/2-C-methyl-D-erythritol 2,4-cyclodiphosphate synthase